MNTRAILCLAGFLAGISPVVAQSCRDEVAGPSVDDEGKYEVSSAGALNSAPVAADVRAVPETSANLTARAGEAMAPATKADAQPNAPLPAATRALSIPIESECGSRLFAGSHFRDANRIHFAGKCSKPEEEAAKSGGDQGKAANPGGPRAMLPAPWRMAQAETGASTQTTDAEPAAPPPAAVAKPRRPKKTSDSQPARKSGAAIVKEGGKTCSGLDEFRVCW